MIQFLSSWSTVHLSALSTSSMRMERSIKRDGKEDVVFKLRVAPNPATLVRGLQKSKIN